MALSQLIATIKIERRRQNHLCKWLQGFDTTLAREGLIDSRFRGFGYRKGGCVWTVIPIGASAARDVKRRLTDHLQSFRCEIAWSRLIDGYLNDVGLCDCAAPPSLLVHKGLCTEFDILRCGSCRGLVALPQLGLTVELREALSSWTSDYHAVENLWLTSRDYESWASRQREQCDSKLNRAGRALAARVEQETHVPTYYWLQTWRVAERDLTWPRLCPQCEQPFVAHFGGQQNLHICESCRLVWPEPVEIVRSRKRFVSALDLMGDLAGSVEGPEDLATNPKYMEGFGESRRTT